MSDQKLTVHIYGDKKDEHHVVFEKDGILTGFCTEKYEGIPSESILKLLEFLGFEIFEVIHDINAVPKYTPLYKLRRCD